MKKIFLILVFLFLILIVSCGINPSVFVGQEADVDNSYFDDIYEKEEATESSETTISEKERDKNELLNSPLYKTANEIIYYGDWDNTKYIKIDDNGHIIKVIFVSDFENSKSEEEIKEIFSKIIESVIIAVECSDDEEHIWGEYIAQAMYDYGDELISFYEVCRCELHPDCYPAG